MLHIDPKMLPRLTEIETDLTQRRTLAQTNGWLGELEGVDLTLSFLHDKKSQLDRRLQQLTNLGIPASAR